MNHESIAAALIGLLRDVKELPQSRELALVATKIEEAIHWIAADQNERAKIVGPRMTNELARVLKEMGLNQATVESHAEKADE